DHGLNAPHLQGGPTRTSRALAIVHGAIFDAINTIDGSYTPWFVHDVHASSGASIDAAAAQAAHDTLVALYPYQRATFDQALAEDLSRAGSGGIKQGAKVGQAVAAEILAARAHDGSDVNNTYTPGNLPGQWRPDPLHPNQTALGPDWGQVTTFGVS